MNSCTEFCYQRYRNGTFHYGCTGTLEHADFHAPKSNSGFSQNACIYRNCGIICNNGAVPSAGLCSFTV